MMGEKDVIREVVQMCRELRMFENNYRSLSEDYSKLRKEHGKLVDTICDIRNIISVNMRHVDELGQNKIVIWEDNPDFKKLCDVLEIPMTGSEVKENED